jgi:hypothetical protein
VGELTKKASKEQNVSEGLLETVNSNCDETKEQLEDVEAGAMVQLERWVSVPRMEQENAPNLYSLRLSSPFLRQCMAALSLFVITTKLLGMSFMIQYMLDIIPFC